MEFGTEVYSRTHCACCLQIFVLADLRRDRDGAQRNGLVIVPIYMTTDNLE
jgi:hypothetical protein